MQIKVDIREHTLIKLLKALNNDYGFNFDMRRGNCHLVETLYVNI